MEGFPAVVAADGVALVVADMVVCGDEDADGVSCGEVGHVRGRFLLRVGEGGGVGEELGALLREERGFCM